ncbi:MAG: hypothetical protein Q4G50_13035 [Corynebacterium sp.]|uniref:hypothetical protein n=1 Tax=Corynebacterium sp. TaxID=1720 RepID=UPI0026E0D422|nr:hypothetical protein [Corynebacterium sp.]MDO5670908.1 hypothetical protein [Corynebacterium sp.]
MNLFVLAPLIWLIGMMLIAGRSLRAWGALVLGAFGGLAIWMITMPRMLLGHEYHWAQVAACGLASVILVIVLGTKVSPKGLLPAWATSFGLTIGFFIAEVLPDETGMSAMGLPFIAAGTAVGLAVPAAFALAFPEPGKGAGGGRREAQ